MTEASARFSLPFILPGQAQKEAFHNEALNLLDCLVHPCVEEAPLPQPPTASAAGQGWIVGAGASGDWAGREDAIAVWTGGGWRFVLPVPGMTAWNKAQGFWMHWSGTGWSAGLLPAAGVVVAGQQVLGPRQSGIASPSGGTTIDVEARAAIDAIIAAFRSHGLTD